MRRSFDGLHALVRDHLDLDPFADISTCSRAVARPLKILYWTGRFALWSKRLEEVPTRFRPPSRTRGA